MIVFETILDEIYSGMDERLREVVRDQGAWVELWGQIHRGVSPRPPLPGVDFSRHMLIAAATGARKSGGFRIAARSVVVREDEFEVEVLETCPAAGAMVSMALTHPVVSHAGRVDATESVTRLRGEAHPRLAPGEVPAILHRGEVVRTPAQEAALRRTGGGSRDAPIIVNIQTPNPRAFNESRGQIQAMLADAVRAGRRNR